MIGNTEYGRAFHTLAAIRIGELEKNIAFGFAEYEPHKVPLVSATNVLILIGTVEHLIALILRIKKKIAAKKNDECARFNPLSPSHRSTIELMVRRSGLTALNPFEVDFCYQPAADNESIVIERFLFLIPE